MACSRAVLRMTLRVVDDGANKLCCGRNTPPQRALAATPAEAVTSARFALTPTSPPARNANNLTPGPRVWPLYTHRACMTRLGPASLYECTVECTKRDMHPGHIPTSRACRHLIPPCTLAATVSTPVRGRTVNRAVRFVYITRGGLRGRRGRSITCPFWCQTTTLIHGAKEHLS